MNDSGDELALKWNVYLTEQRVPVTVITVLFLILGTVGNTLVILTYAFEIKNFRDGRFFIPTLAAVDLNACALTSGFIIYMDATEALFTSDSACKLLECLTVFFVMCSPLLLLVIAIQRYMKVCRPLGLQLNTKWKKISVFLTMIVSAVFAAPFLHFSGTTKMVGQFAGSNVTGEFCALSGSGDPHIEGVFLAGIFTIHVINIAVISVLYTSVGVVVFKTFRGQQTRTSTSRKITIKTSNVNTIDVTVSDESERISSVETGTSNRRRSVENAKGETGGHRSSSARVRHAVKMRFTAMFTTITAFYILSYMPLLVILVSAKNEPGMLYAMPNLELNLHLLLHRCYIINNFVNPMIYGYFDYKFRNAVKLLVRRLYHTLRHRNSH